MIKWMGGGLLACMAVSCMAAGQATASLQGFAVTLKDLDLADGVAPVLSEWNPEVHAPNGLSYVRVSEAPGFEEVLDPHRSASASGLPISVHSASTSAYMRIDDSHCCVDMNGIGMLSSVASTYAVAAPADHADAQSYAYAVGGYFVSPRTSLTLSGSFSVSTSAQSTSAFPDQHVTAVADGWLQIVNGSSEILDARRLAVVSEVKAPGATSDARSGLLSVTFENLSDQEFFVFVSVGADTSIGSSFAAPVPEPAAALLLAIGTVAVSLRHRRQSTAARG